MLDSAGQTALHHATQREDIACCRLLMQYGMDASIVSLQGVTALQLAPASNDLQKLLGSKLPTLVQYLYGCNSIQQVEIRFLWFLAK